MHRLFLLALLVLPALAPASASACWDGTLVSTPHLTFMDSPTVWRADRAREVAKWAPRVEALLAHADLRAEAYWQYVELSDGTEIPVRHHRLDRLFIELARHLQVSRAVRLEALRAPEAVTVQLAAFRDRDRAEAFAATLRDPSREPIGSHGIYEVGGFPADNPTVHVTEAEDTDGRPVFRLVTGVFLDRAQAGAVAREASAQLGTHAFVRQL